MGLLTEVWLLERYGPLITVDQLADVLHLAPRTVANMVSSQELGIPPVKRRPPLFHAHDVAEYLDGLRDTVRKGMR